MSFGNKYSDFLLTNMMKSLIFIFDLGAESCILKSIKFKHNFEKFSIEYTSYILHDIFV